MSSILDEPAAGIRKSHSSAGIEFSLMPFVCNLNIPVAMSEGSHPFPSRTRKLSPPEPMVLRGKPRGRVGRCRIFFEAPIPRKRSRGFAFCGLGFRAREAEPGSRPGPRAPAGAGTATGTLDWRSSRGSGWIHLGYQGRVFRSWGSGPGCLAGAHPSLPTTRANR